MRTERRDRRRFFLLRGWYRLRTEGSHGVPQAKLFRIPKHAASSKVAPPPLERTSGALWHAAWPGSITIEISGTNASACDGTIVVPVDRPWLRIGSSVGDDIRLVDDSLSPRELLLVWTSLGVAVCQFTSPLKGKADAAPCRLITPTWWRRTVRQSCGPFQIRFPLVVHAADLKRRSLAIPQPGSSAKLPLEHGPELALMPRTHATSSTPSIPAANSIEVAGGRMLRTHLTTVGSHFAADWQLPQDHRIQRAHGLLRSWRALIIRDLAHVGIVSLDPSSPIRVNGHPIDAALLELGDRVEFVPGEVYEVIANPLATSTVDLVAPASLPPAETPVVPAEALVNTGVANDTLATATPAT